MRVLVGLDTSEVGERAAIAMAAWSGIVPMEVHLLSVVHPDEIRDTAERSATGEFLESEKADPDPIPPVASGQYGEIGVPRGDPRPMTVEYRGQALARARSEREDYLRGAVTRRLPGTTTTIHVEFSDQTAEAIVETARALGVDAIAMGTHGKGGIRHALMGSIAEQVMRRSPVPVILIGPQIDGANAPAVRSEV